MNDIINHTVASRIKPLRLPKHLYIAWQFFMRPVNLHHQLIERGIVLPDGALYCFQRNPETRHYMMSLLGILLYTTLGITLLNWAFCHVILHDHNATVMYLDLNYWLLAASIGIVLGTALAIFVGAASGVTTGITFGVISAAAVPYIPILEAQSLIQEPHILAVFPLILLFGSLLGFLDSTVYALAHGQSNDAKNVVLRALFITLGLAMIWTLFNQETALRPVNATAIPEIVYTSLGFMTAYMLFYLRVPLYLVECLIQVSIYSLHKSFGILSLRFSPVLHHDISYFPYPYLARHILLSATSQPGVTKKVVQQCAHNSGQRASGAVALARLQARELQQLLKRRRFIDIIALQGRWLPGVRGASRPLLAVREAARYLQAASITRFPYHRLQHLKRAANAVNGLHNQFSAEHSPLARQISMQLPLWKKVIISMGKTAKRSLQLQIPNPFHAGGPLMPERGQEVFKGRELIISQLESLLIEELDNRAILLLAPRRCGKTSTLNMLPALLPDIIWVFFDLQDNPIDSPAAFFQALAKRAQQQAWQHHAIELPPLPTGLPPLKAAAEWFSLLDVLAAERRILICFDEYERLENVFLGDTHKLCSLMKLFQQTLQQHKKIHLLFSGASDFDELDELWFDYFPQRHLVRLNYLEQAAAIELLTRPVASFPAQVLSPAVAGSIYRRTAGQPYLLQLYGAYLIEYLNEHKRKQALPEDINLIEERILEECTYFFRGTLKAAPPSAQQVLERLAKGEKTTISIRDAQWLRRRLLITRRGHLTMPVLGRWIRRTW